MKLIFFIPCLLGVARADRCCILPPALCDFGQTLGSGEGWIFKHANTWVLCFIAVCHTQKARLHHQLLWCFFSFLFRWLDQQFPMCSHFFSNLWQENKFNNAAKSMFEKHIHLEQCSIQKLMAV